MPDDTTNEQTNDPPPPPSSDPNGLGDAGKRALAEERAARKAAEKEAREIRTQLEKLTESTATDHEKAIATAKAEGRNEALREANKRLVRAEVKSAATGKFTNPDLAVRVLDLEDFEKEDGDVDTKRISKAIDDFLKDNPELAASATLPHGDGAGGLRGGMGDPSPNAQMNDSIRRAAGRG